MSKGKTFHSTTMSYIFRDAPSVASGERWRQMAAHAMVSSPLLTVLSSGSFGYLGYIGEWYPRSKRFMLRVLKARDGMKRRLYILAALLIPSFVPFTFATMLPAYAGLQDVAAGKITDEPRIIGLFDRWGRLNSVRGWLIGLGSFVGIWGSLIEG
jgi:hypothetical protein